MRRYLDLFGRECAEPTDCGYGWRPKRGTIVDELRALRAWMRKRDANPWHGWRPPRTPQYDEKRKCVYSPGRSDLFWPKS